MKKKRKEDARLSEDEKMNDSVNLLKNCHKICDCKPNIVCSEYTAVNTKMHTSRDFNHIFC